MNQPIMQDESWREAYRMHETVRLEEQTPDIDSKLERDHLSALCLEAIERRWAKQNSRTAARMQTLFRLRFVLDHSINQCARVLDVSGQRVRQMEAQLLLAIRDHLRRTGVTA